MAPGAASLAGTKLAFSSQFYQVKIISFCYCANEIFCYFYMQMKDRREKSNGQGQGMNWIRKEKRLA